MFFKKYFFIFFVKTVNKAFLRKLEFRWKNKSSDFLWFLQNQNGKIRNWKRLGKQTSRMIFHFYTERLKITLYKIFKIKRSLFVDQILPKKKIHSTTKAHSCQEKRNSLHYLSKKKKKLKSSKFKQKIPSGKFSGKDLKMTISGSLVFFFLFFQASKRKLEKNKSCRELEQMNYWVRTKKKTLLPSSSTFFFYLYPQLKNF